MKTTKDKNSFVKEVHVAGPTRILNIKKSTRSNLYDSLKEGICEVKYTDGSGKKQIKSVTLRKDWIESNKINDWVDYDYESGIMVVWDMNGDEWRGGIWIQIPINKITYFEQLTGVPR